MRRGERIMVFGARRRGFGLVELVIVFAIGAIISGAAFASFSSGWWYGGNSAAAWREARRLARWLGAAVRAVKPAGFVSPVTDFYTTNPIARASAVMAECSALASGRLRQAAE